MRNNLFGLLVAIVCFSCETHYDTPKTSFLHDHWFLKKHSDSAWLNASVPGNVHSDLLQSNQIKNPFIGDNATKLQWVSETDWDYQTVFKVDEITLQKKHITLQFEGLDTYAAIFLNDGLILKTDNAFRQYEVDVKSSLKSENTLRIEFENTKKHEEAEAKKLSYELPEGLRVFTRKAQFQYGWDWAPSLNTSGIWRPIKLISWNDLKLDDVFIVQNSLDDSIANLTAQIELETSLNEELTFDIAIDHKTIKDTTFTTNSTENPIQIPFQIKNPKRWWPYNLGQPKLYDISITVKRDNEILDYHSLRKGLRTLELVAETDAIGQSFYFKVNDVPVYAKGANYVPQNSLQSEVKDTDYEKLLNDVVDANMNMLRVWGGGIYENDIFYDLCDEKGILVWQDFMFACAMYPGEQAFLENVQQEAIDNVKRLRNHASLALWCGNNENSEGWHRWGWQDGKTEAQKTEIWNNYLKLFDSILPKTVAELTDKTSYWESSPRYGRGDIKYKTEGDAHDWWVWHDAYPFEHLDENVPRFMSEFGFQSYPSYELINFINQSDSVVIKSKAFQTHQKHVRGFQLIDDYMKRNFPVPHTDEDDVYMSQLLQSYGITKGIEAHRRAKPYNMGTLYWQLNDCWPAVSWSSIDFLGNWKALQYDAKKAFENVLLSSIIKNDTLKTYVVNDNLEPQEGELYLRIVDFKGNEIWNYCEDISVAANSSELKFNMDLNSLDFNKNETVMIAQFNAETSYSYFAKPKDLALPPEDIQQKLSKTNDGFSIELSSTSLQKDVFLYCDSKGTFSDNFFDLMPDERKLINFITQTDSLKEIKIKTVNEFIDINQLISE